jgi:hypothetical protein
MIEPEAVDAPPAGTDAPTTLRHVGSRTLRAWGMATASFRPPPDFLVIGTKRGGTTSLGRYLFAHPMVTALFPARSAPKGVRYFDQYPDRSERWYRSHFATVLARGPALRPRKLAGEATANYLWHPRAAERAERVAPDARILVLVRDPVDRAWSHWREQARRGVETCSFEEALEAEPSRLAAAWETDDPTAAANVAYRAQGLYADLLPAWLERFGDRVLVLVSEDLYEDPARVYREALAFLGLRPHDLGTYRAWNRRASDEAMPDGARRELEAAFAPANRRLEAILGRPLPWRHRA